MDPDERVNALKKAYADIILNTSKEAAARVMASERKALRYQNELRVAKEEALQMLLRLKHMMDIKTCEAKKTSLSQQGKIEELEAQLYEAEDVVKDLRDELREVQVELERVKMKNIHNTSGHGIQKEMSNQRILCNPNPLATKHDTLAPVDAKDSEFNEISEEHNCDSSISHLNCSYARIADFPSVDLRSKEPQLSRNGCKRIRACERNLLDGEWSRIENSSGGKIESKVRTNGVGKQTVKMTTSEADSMSNLQEKAVPHADGRLSNQCQVYLMKIFHKRRKRAPRYKKKRGCSWRHIPDNYVMIDQGLNISCPRLCRNKTSIDSNGSPQMALKASLGVAGVGTQSRCRQTEIKEEYADIGTINNETDETTHDILSIGQEIASMENLAISPCQIALEKAAVLNSEVEATDKPTEVLCQPANDRIFKYTFKRKRKKESLSSPDRSGSLESITSKKTMVDKQNGVLEERKSALIAESSPEFQRQEEVARQLLSLSEDKWWH